MVRTDSSSPELRPTSRVGRNYFIGTDIGKNIWQRLEEPQTIACLCEKLRTAYQVPDQALFERDVMVFIGNLRLQGLVESSPDARD